MNRLSDGFLAVWQCNAAPWIFPDDINGAAPNRFPAVIDLPQIQNLSLHHPIIGAPTILNDASITGFFAGFETLF